MLPVPRLRPYIYKNFQHRPVCPLLLPNPIMLHNLTDRMNDVLYIFIRHRIVERQT